MEKILLVNCVYGVGSTGKILRDLHRGLQAQGWNSYICFARGQQIENDVHIIKLASEKTFKIQSLFSKITGLSYACSPISTHKLKSVIRKIKPDVVNLHCVNANTMNVVDTLKFLKDNNIPTVVTCHAEFMYTGGCGHSLSCLKWTYGCKQCPQFKKYNSQLPISWFFDRTSSFWEGLREAYSDFTNLRVTTVSPWLKTRAVQSPFFRSEIVSVINNGVDTGIFYPRNAEALREKHHIAPGARVYLHPTPNFLTPLKGGKYILEFARRLSDIDASSRVIILGYNRTEEHLPENVIALPRTSNQDELAVYYSLADSTLIASERETFSMVTAESLCCGTPVVGFKAGGPESICEYAHAAFSDYGDMDAFTEAALKIQKNEEISKKYSPVFSKEQMVENYQKVYREVRKYQP